MGSNICEFVQNNINLQHFLRQILRIVNNQIDCSNDDCIDDNYNELNSNLQQIDHGHGSVSFTFGYLLFLFLMIWIVLPSATTNLHSINPLNRLRNRRRTDDQQESNEKLSKKRSDHGHHNNDDDDDPGIAS